MHSFYLSTESRCSQKATHRERDILIELNELSGKIIGCAIDVHSKLGPGLLEEVYKKCLAYKLEKNGLKIRSELPLNIKYEELEVHNAYRLDLLVEEQVILELKAVDSILPVHKIQLLTYLRMSGIKLGLLINFNVPRLKDGISRLIN